MGHSGSSTNKASRDCSYDVESLAGPEAAPVERTMENDKNLISKECVLRVFRMLLSYGSALGCRLLCRDDKELCIHTCLKKLAFIVVVLIYLFGMITVLITLFPHPQYEKVEYEFDIPSGFLIVCILLALDGMGCFIALNHAMKVIARKNGFCDQITEYLSSSKFKVDFRPWRKVVYVNFFRCGIWAAGYVCLVTLHILDYDIPYPVRYERSARWLSLPVPVLKGFFHMLGFMTFFHASYHGNFFSNVCMMIRLQFAHYCRMVKEETAHTFSTGRIGYYQSEYSRLAELTDCLDRAFKHACFCQLFLFVTTTCFNLFLFTRKGLDLGTGIIVCFPFAMITVSFLYTILPAILLKGEAEKPKKYLRLWYLKYETACDQGAIVPSEAERQAICSLMQWISLENVGITVSNLARLDAPLLLNVGSVVITYFLVILQFTTSSSESALTQLQQNVTAFCLEHCPARFSML